MASPQTAQNCPSCGASAANGARYCGSCGGALAPTKSSQFDIAHAPDEADVIGKEIAGRYRILAKLGEGGMGAVYRAEQISLKRTVALKVLRRGLSEEPGLVRRFNAEAELAAKLNHPNTVTLYDFGQDQDGSLFIAMEFIEGRSLRHIMTREGPLHPERIVHIMSQVCASLSDAHAHGIVHRDLKPDNVMLATRGKKSDLVTVLDFGIAKLRDEHGAATQMPMTQAGDMLGTPQYMAPEQIRAEKVDPRTDVYALGCMLYEMTTGRLPFMAPTVMALLSMHLTDSPEPPMLKRPELQLPQALSDLIVQCLAKNPLERPASMEEVEERLIRSVGASTDVVGVPNHRAPSAPATLPSAPAGYRSPPPGVPMTPPPGAAPNMAFAPTGYGGTGHQAPAAMGQAPTALPRQGMGPQSGAPVRAGSEPAFADVSPPVERPKRSRAPFVILALLVLLGAGGAGAYFLFLKDKGKETSSEKRASTDDFNAGDWESGEGSEELVFDDGDDDEDEGDEIELGTNTTASQLGQTQTYTDAVFGYRLSIPVSMVGAGAGNGAATFTGLVDGNLLTVISFGWQVPGLVTEEATQELVEDRLEQFGFVVDSMSWRRIKGRPALLGTCSTLDRSEKAQFILTSKGATYVMVAIGAQASHFNASTSFREAFFQHGVELP